jgi:hypothetical protein
LLGARCRKFLLEKINAALDLLEDDEAKPNEG